VDFTFLGGSWVRWWGEKLTRLIEKSTEKGLPASLISQRRRPHV